MWTFIQEQIFSMKWLRDFIGNLLSALGFDITKKIGGSIQFFLYDVIKIVILLCILIFVISYIQSFFPPERSKKILGRFHGIIANIIAALLGTVTPFWTCHSSGRGTIIEKLHLENQVEEFIRNAKHIDIQHEELTIKDRIKYSAEKVEDTFKYVRRYLYSDLYRWNHHCWIFL